MNSNEQQSALRAFGASLWSLLFIVAAGEAQASNADALQQLADISSKAQERAARRDARDMQRELRVMQREIRTMHNSMQPAAQTPGIVIPNIGADNDVSKNGNGASGLNTLNSMSRRTIPGVSEFRTTRPERVSNRSTFLTDAGRSRILHNGVSLDLSSTDANITVGAGLLDGATITIQVGDETKQITAGSKVTAAEYAALSQALATGSQELKLNSSGAAVDGSLNLNVVSDNGRTIKTSELVIPESVEVSGDFGRHADGVRVTNDLINYGSLYAFSSKRGKDTAVIAARDVNNFEGGLITSNAPDAVAQQLGAKNDSLNLSIRADRNLSNSGEISSSGALVLTAGGVLTNSGSASARGSVSINSANINNSGQVSASLGNINISSPIDSNLAVDSTGGAFNALNGNINIATTVGLNQKTNTTLVGGEWHAKDLNIVSGDGTVSANVGDVTAKVNVTSGIISFNADAAQLITGDMIATGDPLLSSTGDILISSSIISSGPISIVAGGNITANPGVSLNSSSSGTGGEIFIAAGAQFTDNGSILTVSGGTVGGGSILIPDAFSINSNGGIGNGGRVTILAFEGSTSGSGRAILSSTNISATGANGGNVKIIAEGSGAPAVNVSQINASSNSSGVGGSIELYNSSITLAPNYEIISTPGPSAGGLLDGGSLPGAFKNGGITFSQLTSSGVATINLSSNGAISGSTINLNNTSGNTGAISIYTLGASGSIAVTQINSIASGTTDAITLSSIGSVDVGILSQGFTGTGPIGIVSQGAVRLTDVISDAQGGSAGTISITTDGGIRLGQNLITNGISAGDITLTALGNITTLSSTNVTANGNTSAGDITIYANGFTFSDQARFSNADGLAKDASIGLYAQGSTITPNFNFVINSGNGISISTVTQTITNSVGGNISWTAVNGDINTNNTSIVLTTNSLNGGITISANNGEMYLGSITALSTANASVSQVSLSTRRFITLGNINTDSAFVDGSVRLQTSSTTNDLIAPTITAGKGSVTLISTGSNVQLNNPISAGDLQLQSDLDDVQVNIVIPTFTSVSLLAPNGTVDVGFNDHITLAPGATGNSGAIEIRAFQFYSTVPNFELHADSGVSGNGGTITVDVQESTPLLSATANGTLGGGDISLKYKTGSTVTVGQLSANGANGDGGSITVNVPNADLRFNSSLSATGTANGGVIDIDSPIQVYFLNPANVVASGGLAGTAPRIEINSNQLNLSAAAGSTNQFSATGATQVGAGVLITVNNIVGASQNLNVNSSSDIRLTGNINLSGSAAPGGNLNLTAGGSIFNPLNTTVNLRATSFGANAGSVNATAGTSITMGSIDMTSAAIGGSVLFDAGSSLTAGSINTVGQNGSGVVSLNAGTNLTVGAIDTHSGDFDGGNVAIIATGAVNAVDIYTYGEGAAGDVTVSSSGNVTVGTVLAFATGLANGTGGDVSLNGNSVTAGELRAYGWHTGGNVTVTGGVLNLYKMNTFSNTGDAGDINITSSGGSITFISGTILDAHAMTGAAGDVLISATSSAVQGVESVDVTGATTNGVITVNVDSLSTTGVLTLDASNIRGGTGGSIEFATGATGGITSNGLNFRAVGDVTLNIGSGGISAGAQPVSIESQNSDVVASSADISVTNQALVITSAGSLGVGGIDAGTGSVTLSSGDTLSVNGPVNANLLSIGFVTGSVSLTTTVNTLSYAAAGLSVDVTQTSGNLAISGTADSVSVQLAGASARLSVGTLINHTNVDLRANGGSGGIDFKQNLNVGSSGALSLRTLGGTITQDAGTTLTALDLSITQLSGGTATLTNANNFGSFNGSGTGSVNLNNGSNALNVVGVGLGQSLTAQTSSAQGIALSAGFGTTGDLDLTADRFAVSAAIGAGSISLTSFSGNLTVEGATGASLSATAPAAGTPGNPSNPAAIQITTGSGATLSLVDKLAFAGDVYIDNTGGTTTSQNNSLFSGGNNITLKTNSWVMNGNGNITANNLILDLPFTGTIINTTGDINISNNITFLGQDVAILAFGNINITNNAVINLSNTIGSGGDLLMVAGWELTPPAAGQQNSPVQYEFGAANPAGGSVNAATASIITQATAGISGSVTVIASGGSISLGAIDTQSPISAGPVLLVGQTGVTVGGIDASSIEISVSAPVLTGANVYVQNGTLTGGTFGAGSTATTGAIATGGINATGLVKMSTLSNITISGELTTGGVDITGNNVSLTGFDLVKAQSATVSNRIIFNVNDLTTTSSNPITMQALGNASGAGSIQLNRLSNSAISVGGDYKFVANGQVGGSVGISSGGDITVEDGSILVTATNGNGGAIRIETPGTLTLNTTGNFFNVDAAVSGTGGAIELRGNSIVIPSGALSLSADGAGTGAGGSLIFSSEGTTATYIGAPAKAPKPPFVVLDLSATAGSGGGNGGLIDVEVGGNLTANAASMNAAPSSVGNNAGASYSLTAGGSLVVAGALDASGVGTGDGGSIYLESNNKKAFSIGSGKVPKNGVQGAVTANGDNGRIAIVNRGGGVSLAQNLDAEEISLTAALKGTITTGKTVEIEAQKLTLVSDLGAIGKKPLVVDISTLKTTSNAAVNINNLFAGELFVESSTAGKGGFNLTNAGKTVLTQLAVNGGSIDITSADDLTLVPGAEVTAVNGAISLVNSNANGSIKLNSNAVVATDGDKGGAVTIAIGVAPKKGVNRLVSDPPALTVTEIGKKGLAYYDGAAAGLVVNGTGNVVIAENKPVYLSNTGTGTITIDGGVTIHADPPSVVSSAGLSDVVRGAGQLSMSPGAPAADVSSQSLMTVGAAQPMPSFGDLPLLGKSSISSIGLGNATIAANQTGALCGLTGASIASGFADGENASGTTMVSNGFAPDAVSSSGNGFGNELIVDAKFVSDKQASHVVGVGKIVFAPQSDITVETQHGTLRIAANSIAVVAQSSDGLSVYNLDDHGKNAVVLQTRGKQFSLTPGQHVTVSNHASELYSEVNAIELVQHRGMNKSMLNNGWKVFTSEFSITSACYAVKPLRELVGSNYKGAAKLRNHLMKTAAVIMMLRPDQGDFVQHFKSYTTAMK